MTEKLTRKQEAFVREYLLDLNAAAAARRAGYSVKVAREQGYENLTKPHILARVQALQTERFKRLQMSADETLAVISNVARFHLGKIVHLTDENDPYFDLSKASQADWDGIKKVRMRELVDRRERDADGNVIAREVLELEVQAHDKAPALTLLAKHHKLTVDRVELAASEDFCAHMQAAERRAEGR